MKQTLILFAIILSLSLSSNSALGMKITTKKWTPSIQRPLPDLVDAAAQGDIATMALLLKSGHNVDERTSSNSTALMLAALQGHRTAIYKVLLPAYPFLDACNDQGNTAMHAAAKAGDPIIIKMLARAGANLDLQNKYGNTPLHVAAQNGKSNALAALLEKGARPDIRNNRDEKAEDIVIDMMLRKAN